MLTFWLLGYPHLYAKYATRKIVNSSYLFWRQWPNRIAGKQ